MLSYIKSIFNRNRSKEYPYLIFESYEKYRTLQEEFQTTEFNDIQEGFRQTQETAEAGDMGTNSLANLYAIIRELKPSIVVETGVCNGFSSLVTLLAMEKNRHGHLYSIDYPYRSDISLQEFRDETFENYGGASIPKDKEPGWIIPERLRNRWSLREGKSQKQLCHLSSELSSPPELFIHDSEHSYPCMMFEYEWANTWIESGGVIISDDISWNDSFKVFTEERSLESQKISENFGYMLAD